MTSGQLLDRHRCERVPLFRLVGLVDAADRRLQSCMNEAKRSAHSRLLFGPLDFWLDPVIRDVTTAYVFHGAVRQAAGPPIFDG
ncbi:unnamed protein product [Lasius platythorax]|uniref:Uncharacterized protein n=1 Tax=Lasius platythorax TaxID=488582 RepID=A0AAV2PCK6_9HYME